MKKFGKIFFVTLLSLFSILLVAICLVIFLVFTPARFTPIVRQQVNNLITCKSEIGEVELTFFSTFPNFGLKIKQFALINPVENSQTDTLVKVDELVGVIDAAAWWNRNELIIKGLEFNHGTVNVFSDSLGHTNYDIFASDSSSVPTTETELIIPKIDIRNVILNEVNLSYNDLSLKLNTLIRNLSAEISATVSGDNVSGKIKMKNSLISLAYEGEKYLEKASVTLEMPLDVILSRELISFNNAKGSINDLELSLSGSVENDTVNKNIITDLKYELASWPVADILALVPPAYRSYLNGIEADGLLSSNGIIKGNLNDSAMPLMEINLLFEKGALKYTGYPQLHDIKAGLTLYTDLKTDSISYLKIREFDAKTPLSKINVTGTVTHLFTDISCDLNTTAGLILDEFNPLIPGSMKIKLRGKAAGTVKSVFSLSQLEKMQIERMKLSGSVTFSGLDAAYDSISLKTDRMSIDFSLPNSGATSKNTKFAFAAFRTDNFFAGKTDSYSAFLKDAAFILETSDARDTTRTPNIICSFHLDSLSANMDTMSIAVAKPIGRFTVSPGLANPVDPRITLTYNSEQLKTNMGPNSFEAKTISLDADIINDNTQKDIVLRWLVKGFVDLNKGMINIAGFSHPVEIPSVKMNFDPEAFNIKESIMKIGRSDFQLTGSLNNISSYFRGDSILRGKFDFVSNATDITQLMALTNGIGYADSAGTKKAEIQDSDTTYTGPYMVPKKIDLLLKANIKKAAFGADSASNILGNVQVNDGILVLDDLSFETPAGRMQLTAIYRTPRKNHLFLGLDYHMLNVEIEELLTMIPDIDSLMPMLRSFRGKGEFHIAVETYLDSLYNMKKSTLRGASSIKGSDLVLMDGQTFSDIAKTLRFNKKTENKVDSLSAEFTIFRNEIDVYPFLLVMDKYKAIISGRHNFDLTYDYHISVVDSPLPIKLGVDVKGNEDDFKCSLAKCRYSELYRPVSRKSVESKQLELRKLIRETLIQKLKD
jgi:hypothetical protein